MKSFLVTALAVCCSEGLICIFMVEFVELLLMTIGLENAFVRPGSKGCRKTTTNEEREVFSIIHV